MLDVLVVDDDDIVRGSIAEAIAGAGHRVAEASDGEQALVLLSTRTFDLALCDVQMPRLDGMTLFRRLRDTSPDTAVVIMTTFGKIPDAVGTLRDGAIDYVTKPFDPEEFTLNVVGPIAERRALMKDFEAARARLVAREAGSRLVGASLVMRQIEDFIGIAGKSDSSVLVTGARGTGKKLVARMLHARSPRRRAPFIVVPCALMPDRLIGSERHDWWRMYSRDSWERWFQLADGGTLVLDGVEKLPSIAQADLLRVLGEPSLRARRDHDWQPLGVRLISLAQSNPRERVGDGSFLESLLLRLNAVDVRLPSLGEREGDLYMLVQHFLRESTPPGRGTPAVTPRAWKALSTYGFPGNVYELAWAVEHAVTASAGDEIDLGHLPAVITR